MILGKIADERGEACTFIGLEFFNKSEITYSARLSDDLRRVLCSCDMTQNLCFIQSFDGLYPVELFLLPKRTAPIEKQLQKVNTPT